MLQVLRAPSQPPVRLTEHEKRVWYALSANEGETVPGAALLYTGWGHGYDWNDRDEYVRHLNRALVYVVVYMLRRLLEAHGGRWRIANDRAGYRLERTS